MNELENLVKLLSENSVSGAAFIALLAFFYKFFLVIKRDKHEDNLTNAERSFREEIRADRNEMKKEIQRLQAELIKERDNNYKTILDLQQKVAYFEHGINRCKNQNKSCPFNPEPIS